jgi:SAM-dependent methyltransferase
MSSIFRKLVYTLSYFGHPPWDTGVSPPELSAFIDSHPPGRALDLGCGTGTNLISLARHGWDVTGIDFSAYAVRAARRKLKTHRFNAQVIRGDVTRKFIVEGQFDLILDIGCYHGLSPQSRVGYRINLHDKLKSGATYLLYAHWQIPEKSRATGVSQADIDALSAFLHVVDITHTSDHWGRHTTWMTFINSV